MKMKFHEYEKHFRLKLNERLSKSDPDWNFKVESVDNPKTVLNESFQIKLLSALLECPNGVIGWSKSIPGLVETSTNLASIKFISEIEIQVVTSQRSSVDFEKKEIASKVSKIFGSRSYYSNFQWISRMGTTNEIIYFKNYQKCI